MGRDGTILFLGSGAFTLSPWRKTSKFLGNNLARFRPFPAKLIWRILNLWWYNIIRAVFIKRDFPQECRPSFVAWNTRKFFLYFISIKGWQKRDHLFVWREERGAKVNSGFDWPVVWGSPASTDMDSSNFQIHGLPHWINSWNWGLVSPVERPWVTRDFCHRESRRNLSWEFSQDDSIFPIPVS